MNTPTPRFSVDPTGQYSDLDLYSARPRFSIGTAPAYSHGDFKKFSVGDTEGYAFDCKTAVGLDEVGVKHLAATHCQQIGGNSGHNDSLVRKANGEIDEDFYAQILCNMSKADSQLSSKTSAEDVDGSSIIHHGNSGYPSASSSGGGAQHGPLFTEQARKRKTELSPLPQVNYHIPNFPTSFERGAQADQDTSNHGHVFSKRPKQVNVETIDPQTPTKPKTPGSSMSTTSGKLSKTTGKLLSASMTVRDTPRKRAPAKNFESIEPRSLPANWAAAGRADKLLWLMKKDGEDWSTIRAVWLHQTGQETAHRYVIYLLLCNLCIFNDINLENSSLPNRFNRLKPVFGVLPSDYYNTVAAVKHQVEQEMAVEKWLRVAEILEKKAQPRNVVEPFAIESATGNGTDIYSKQTDTNK